MGSARNIPTYRLTGPANQNMDGVTGRTAGWIVSTGTGRTRLANNGAGTAKGSYFNDGETWWGIVAYRISASGHYPARFLNWHDEAVSGYSWGGVSPVARDCGLPGAADFDSGFPSVAVLEYATTCSGIGAPFFGPHGYNTWHKNVPQAVGEYQFEFYKIKFKNDCTGSFEMWVQNSTTTLADGPVVNLTSVRTLNNAAGWFPGCQFWQGMYSTMSPGDPSIQIDHMLSMWGSSAQAAWDDVPVFVEYQENTTSGHDSTCVALGAINTSTFPIPTDWAGLLSDPPSGGGGGGGGATGQIGKTDVGLSWNTVGTPYEVANSGFVVPVSKTYRIDAAHLYLRGNAAVPGTENLKAMIWADSSGLPGNASAILGTTTVTGGSSTNLSLTSSGTRVHYNASSKTQSVTLAGGVDLLVVRHVNRDNADVVTAMTYNGIALTKKGSKVDGGGVGYATLWYLIAPATGTAHNLVITLDGSSHSCDFDWLGFTGSDQTTPLRGLSTTNGHTSSMGLTVTDGAVGDILIDCGFIYQDTPPTPSITGGQTQDDNAANSTSAADPYMVASHIASSASVSPGWSWPGARYFAYMAVNVKAAAGSGTAAGWQTITPGSPPSLAAGSYWAGVIDQGTSGAAQIAMDAGAAGSLQFKSVGTYSTIAVTDPFGTPDGAATDVLSLYLDWTDVTTGVPTVTTLPTATVLAAVGSVLTVDNGVWTGSPSSYAYQWQRDVAGNGTYSNTTGTTASRTVVSGDIGCHLRCQVTAHNGAGDSSPANSNPSQIVTAAIPIMLTPVTVTGSARVGQVLTAVPGTWTNTPTLTYQWQRDTAGNGTFSSISGETATTHLVTGADLGNTVRVVETATNGAGAVTNSANAAGLVSNVATTPVLFPVPI